MISSILHGWLLRHVVANVLIEGIQKEMSSGGDAKGCQDKGKLKNC